MAGEKSNESRPDQTEPLVTSPIPVEDLERRVKVLRDSGVQAYKDGSLEIVFARSTYRNDPMESALAEFLKLEQRNRPTTGGT